mgnify:CR=1 FL=1
MTEQDIYKLLADGERVTLECKKAQNGVPNSLWETYSAFANCYGGVIILGVVENKDGSWRTTGLDAADKGKIIKQFWDAINNHKKVNIRMMM